MIQEDVGARLKRLVERAVCPAEDASEYREELRHLADEYADPEEARETGRLFKALGDDKRVRLLRLLGLREMCVCELMVALELTQPTASHHLGILEKVGLVSRRKEGKWVYYSIKDPKLLEGIREIGPI